MNKEVKLIELSPEQIQELLNNQAVQKVQEDTDAVIEQAIINMSPEELADYLSSHLASTNVIIEAMNLVSEFSMQDAIFAAALNRSRIGLDSAIAWIENHFSLNEEQAEEENKENNTESPNTNKGKRIVYGKNENSLPEDDSEQL